MAAEQLTRGALVSELENILVRVVFIAPELDRNGKAVEEAEASKSEVE